MSKQVRVNDDRSCVKVQSNIHTLRESRPSTRTVNTLLFDERPLTVIKEL